LTSSQFNLLVADPCYAHGPFVVAAHSGCFEAIDDA